MNIPIPNTDQFLYTPPTPDPGGVDRFVKNLAALQDPSGTLARLQAEEVAKATADIKMEDIDAQYQRLALKSLQDYQQNRMNMYKGNKKFSRLKLSGEQILEDQLAYKRMLMDINTLKQTSQENAQTMQEVYKMYASQVLTPEEYSEFEKRRQEADAKATDIGSVPRYRNILNNYLQTKPQRVTADQTKWIYKTPEELAKAVWGPQVGQTAPNMKQMQTKVSDILGSPVWNAHIRPMMQSFGYFAQGMTPEQEYASAVKYLSGEFNPKEGRVGNTYISNNMPRWEKEFKPKFSITNNNELEFKTKPTDGIVVTFDVDPKESGGTGVAAGDLFIPAKTFVENGVRYLTGTTVSKGTFKMGPDGVAEISQGTTYSPVTIPLNDQMIDMVETYYFPFDQTGTPKRDTWKKLAPTAQGAPAKPQSTINPGYENVWPAGEDRARYIVNGYPHSYEEVEMMLEGTGLSISRAIDEGKVKVELPKK